MHLYLVRRIVFLSFVLFGVSVITFTVARVLPSDPAALWAGPRATPEQVAKARDELGLDRPLSVQYLKYLQGVLTGDWGRSIQTRRPVLDDVKRFTASSMELVAVSMFIAVLLGIPLGVVSAVKKDSIVDHVSRLISISGVSMPVFWLGMLCQILFFRTLGLLPLNGRIDPAIAIFSPIESITGFYLVDTLLSSNVGAFASALSHLTLPALTLSYASLAVVTRMTRSSMVEHLNRDYVRTARSVGFSEWVVIFRYTLKNALIPTLTVVGLTFGYLLSGTFVVEMIFDWPGLGTYAVKAVNAMDYPAILGVTMVVTIVYLVVNLIVDLLQAFVDPRIKLE